MCLSITEKHGSIAHSSTSTISAGLLHLLVGALVHFVWQELQADVCGCRHPSLPPRMTIIGIPGWAPTGIEQPKTQA